MVFFVCDLCGESLKKNQVEKHGYRCHTQSYSCIDCQQLFSRKSYADHIKCITEDQKYGGKDYVQKEFKGAAKQQTWTNLVQGAIEHVTDPNVKRYLHQIKGFDNIPRKEAKFINFLQNSHRIQQNVARQVWSAISAETERLKKEAEEQKKAEAEAAAQSQSVEKKEEEAAEKVESASEKAGVDENATETAPEISFKWKSSIKRKLKEAGGEMKMKKLKKEVIADYEEAGGTATGAEELFAEKLKKTGVTLNGKLVHL